MRTKKVELFLALECVGGDKIVKSQIRVEVSLSHKESIEGKDNYLL